jgi:hypothetical protein
MFSDIKGGEQGAEENIRTEEELSTRRVEKSS